MKLFYLSMLLIIFTISFSLFPTRNIKTDQLDIIQTFSEIEKKDTLMLFEMIDGEENAFFMPFNGGHLKEAYFKNDTIRLDFFGGLYGGYSLKLTITENDFTSQVQHSGCTWLREMKIKNQSLKIEKPTLVDQEKLRAYIFCEAENLRQDESVEKIIINGYFEMNLREASNY